MAIGCDDYYVYNLHTPGFAGFLSVSDETNAGMIKNIVTALLFLQVHPATWQASGDGPKRLQRTTEVEYGSKAIANLHKLSDDEMMRIALETISGLLYQQDEAILS